jgi:hypothetical protein
VRLVSTCAGGGGEWRGVEGGPERAGTAAGWLRVGISDSAGAVGVDVCEPAAGWGAAGAERPAWACAAAVAAASPAPPAWASSWW